MAPINPCVPQYIRTIEEAQKRAHHAGLPISDTWLAAFATKYKPAAKRWDAMCTCVFSFPVSPAIGVNTLRLLRSGRGAWRARGRKPLTFGALATARLGAHGADRAGQRHAALTQRR